MQGGLNTQVGMRQRWQLATHPDVAHADATRHLNAHMARDACHASRNVRHPVPPSCRQVCRAACIGKITFRMAAFLLVGIVYQYCYSILALLCHNVSDVETRAKHMAADVALRILRSRHLLSVDPYVSVAVGVVKAQPQPFTSIALL